MKTRKYAARLVCLAIGIYGHISAGAENCVLTHSPVTTLFFSVGEEMPLPGPDTMTTIPASHTDIEIPLRFAGWDIHIKTDHPSTNTRIDITQALFVLGRDHEVVFGSIPPAFAFIGMEPYPTFWSYDQEVPPAPGFDSQDMSTAETNALCLWDPNDPVHGAAAPNRWLRINLVEVRGPHDGHVSMWQESGITPRVFFSTVDGIDESDVFYIPVRQHVHNSWAFTQPGRYEVDIQVSTSFYCDPALSADLNGDCRVDMEDFAGLAALWLCCDCATVSPGGSADITSSGRVEWDDLLEFAAQWLLCGTPFQSECP